MGIDLAAVVAAATALRQAILDRAGPEAILRRGEDFLATLAPERTKVGGKFRDLENADTLPPEQRRLLREAGRCVTAFGFAYDLLGQRSEVLDLLAQVEALGQPPAEADTIVSLGDRHYQMGRELPVTVPAERRGVGPQATRGVDPLGRIPPRPGSHPG
jgi:hypothetical protein